MSKKTLLALAFAAMAMPTAAFGQIGIAARGGTLGIGGEVAIGLGSRLQVRGGIGTTKYSYTGTFDNKKWTVDAPSSIWNAGVDLFLAGGFHLSAGMLNRPKFDFAYNQSGSQTVGNTTYNATVAIVGEMNNEKETAPYVGLGFGRTSKKGFGLTLDLGAAQMGEGKLTITQKSCTTNAPGGCPASFNNDVETERQKVQNDIGGFLKWHPIISIGLHIGL